MYSAGEDGPTDADPRFVLTCPNREQPVFLDNGSYAASPGEPACKRDTLFYEALPPPGDTRSADLTMYYVMKKANSETIDSILAYNVTWTCANGNSANVARLYHRTRRGQGLRRDRRRRGLLG